ncbi:MAG: hypothetical protein LQ340_005414 [Diploschistes diacapsis]|nr:MAG: hypothetical protein LQ340_005414 [Diploschistes diacapsis]
MASRDKSLFVKSKRKPWYSRRFSPLGFHQAQSSTRESADQHTTAPEDAKTKLEDEYGIKVLCSPDRPRAEHASPVCWWYYSAD